ncbi:MAG: hypothetical protein L0338_22205 [Acidobacteria bacterium]|nr:hypothetical protein [Acidobacteriota bacterium]
MTSPLIFPRLPFRSHSARLNELLGGSTLQWIPRVSSLLGISLGLLVLWGWLIAPKSFVENFPALAGVSPNTALAFALIGFSFRFSRLEAISPWAHGVSKFFRVGVGLLGLITFGELMLVWRTGIDGFLFAMTSPAIDVSYLRMTPASAISFYLAGCSLILLSAGRGFVLCQILSFTIALTSVAAIIASLLAPAFVIMDPAVAVVMLLLCTGIIYTNSHRGLMAVVTSETPGGALARRLLPTCVAAPVVLAWLRLAGQQAGWFSVEAGLVLHVVLSISVFGIAVFWNACVVTRTSGHNDRIEERLREYEMGFLQALQDTAELALVCNAQGILEFANQSARNLLGLEGHPIDRYRLVGLVTAESRSQVTYGITQALVGFSSVKCPVHIASGAQSTAVVLRITPVFQNGQPARLIVLAGVPAVTADKTPRSKGSARASDAIKFLWPADFTPSEAAGKGLPC